MYEYNGAITCDFPLGTMFVIIQSSTDKRFDNEFNETSGMISFNSKGQIKGEPDIDLKMVSTKNVSEAAQLILTTFNKTKKTDNDLYRFFTMDIEKPYITINHISDHIRGDCCITINGTTNQGVGEYIGVDISSQQGSLETKSGVGGQIRVEADSETNNKWEYTFNVPKTWRPDIYDVSIYAFVIEGLNETTFNVT